MTQSPHQETSYGRVQEMSDIAYIAFRRHKNILWTKIIPPPHKEMVPCETRLDILTWGLELSFFQ